MFKVQVLYNLTNISIGFVVVLPVDIARLITLTSLIIDDSNDKLWSLLRISYKILGHYKLRVFSKVVKFEVLHF
jgi:hypothetical protein